VKISSYIGEAFGEVASVFIEQRLEPGKYLIYCNVEQVLEVPTEFVLSLTSQSKVTFDERHINYSKHDNETILQSFMLFKPYKMAKIDDHMVRMEWYSQKLSGYVYEVIKNLNMHAELVFERNCIECSRIRLI